MGWEDCKGERSETFRCGILIIKHRTLFTFLCLVRKPRLPPLPLLLPLPLFYWKEDPKFLLTDRKLQDKMLFSLSLLTTLSSQGS